MRSASPWATAPSSINPDEDALVETAVETAKTAAYFGIDPKVAMLSYSTKGSGKGDDVTKVRQRHRQGQGRCIPS